MTDRPEHAWTPPGSVPGAGGQPLSPYPPPAVNRRPPPLPPGVPPAPAGTSSWPARPSHPMPGWPHPAQAQDQMRATSGLFPTGPPRPVFREPYPIKGGAVALGMVGGGLWMMLFGLLATNARGYAWISLIAGILGWLVAALLTRLGDRGAAVGVAISIALGLSIAVVVIGARWALGDWLLW
jgi:hypothetical protein